MTVLIGHARHDEFGNARNGAAGDQKQTTSPDYSGEVSISNWYAHKLGWVLIRAKDAAAREKIARNAEYACNNKNIGYDQSQNRTLYNIVKNLGYDCSKVTTKCETDCAQLVRVCVLYAGIKTEDFYTVTEKDVLYKTGKFNILTSDKYCKSSDYLLRGDILVTKTKGHTVIVLSDGEKVKKETAPKTTSSLSEKIRNFQEFLNNNYAQILKSANISHISLDGKYGPKTRAAALAVWKYMANKYYRANLTIGNTNFFYSCKFISARMTDEEVGEHFTLQEILKGILAGKGYSSVIEYQKAKKIQGDGHMNAETWYSLFN